MGRDKKPRWCNWPNREYQRGDNDLYLTGLRCDAWREFFSSETLRTLKRIKGHCIWFNRYEYFDKLIAEFDCAERTLRNVIKGLLLPGFQDRPIDFLRSDIYDARAWARVPLNWLLEGLQSFGERDPNQPRQWQHEVLETNQVPEIQFGVKKPWIVTRDCFSLRHRLKDDGRFAEMTFAHPDLDPRFENKRWVADGKFAREATRAEMEAALFAQVEERCARHLVTITEQ